MKIQVRGSAVTLINNAVGSPTISGDAEVGEELTAVPGTITDSDGGVPATDSEFNYQWQRETASGTWEDISGATSISYTLDMVDMGLRIRVLVSFTDSLSNDEELASGPTAAVAAASGMPAGTTPSANDPPPQISVGTATPSFRTENGATVVCFSFSALSGAAPAGGFDVEWRVVVDSSAGNALRRWAGARATAACTVSSCRGRVTFAAGSRTLADPVIDAKFDTALSVDTVVQVQIRRPAEAANLAVVPSPDVAASEQIADSEWGVAGVTRFVAETPAALVHAVAGTGRAAATEIVDSIWRRVDARRARNTESQARLGGRVLDTRALSSGDAERAVREVASLFGLKASDTGDSLEAVAAVWKSKDSGIK